MVALADLLLAGAALYFALFARYRSATICFLVALPLYLAWAILVDAVVHGWDDLILLP